MLRIPSSGRRLVPAPAAVLAISVLFIAFGNLRGDSTGNSQPEEVELITLRPAAFEPAEITRSKGPFVLFIDDRSGKENSSLVLQRVTSERLRAININRKKSDWHDVVDLAPGTYVLQESSNSELRCQITILP